MKTRQFGNTDMHITPIGFGSWAVGGGDWQFGWGDQDDQESINAIRKAIDLGMNWIDTAAVYGLGHSEEVVAEAVKGMQNKPWIFTKCAMTWDESRIVVPKITAESVRKECEASLRRLNVDVIDLYQIHWPNPEEEIEEGWETLVRLKEEGKIRWIGVSNFNVAQLKRIMPYGPVSSLQPPYSLVNRAVEEEILPYCKENNIGVIVYSPMGAGILTGTMTRERVASFPHNDWRRRSSYYQEPALTKNLALQDKLKEIGVRHNCSAAEVAIAWTLLNPAVTAAIVGGRSAAQVEGVIGAANVQLSPDDIREIKEFVTF